MLTPNQEAIAIRAAFQETEIRFIDDLPEVLAAFKSAGREISFDNSGRPVTSYDSMTGVPLAQALTRWARDNREVCDARTLPRTEKDGRPSAQSKADFVTRQQKVAFIHEFGEAAYSALPNKAAATQELKFLEDFWNLPQSQKAKILENDPNFPASLPRRPKATKLDIFNQKAAQGRARFKAELDAQQAAEIEAARAAQV